ncbi:imelysin family protein [Maritimibacter sp. DP1N21-5]|uniref:imelysin family protein n=1 Tax=Maritimibacter sp. DP1N21-5 TaxID=2836867 RepID=UPI001C45DB08|nr:imelysin family protein [Maritimibacter sp. DP1N21-5]MBV7410954.1 imelysin family protein [Maritimibacter sp. DP1N21-5]
MIRTTLAAFLIATSAQAGVDEALDEVIHPGLDNFAATAQEFAGAAQESCLPANLTIPYDGLMQSWMRVGDLRIGPSEHGALSIAFWPDTRGFTDKTLSRLIADEDPVVNDPAAMTDLSIAARGLFALDMLLFDPEFSDYDTGSYTCRLVTALAEDLSAQAVALADDWTSFEDTLRSAGASGNVTYLSEDEATRAIYTQILTSLEFTADTRLGRPLGEVTRPRPARAEAWRSNRSLPNVVTSVQAAVALAEALSDDPLPQTQAALEGFLDAASKVTDPGFQDIDDPSARLLLEITEQRVDALRQAIEVEVGAPMGLTPGFNSSDGD